MRLALGHTIARPFFSRAQCPKLWGIYPPLCKTAAGVLAATPKAGLFVSGNGSFWAPSAQPVGGLQGGPLVPGAGFATRPAGRLQRAPRRKACSDKDHSFHAPKSGPSSHGPCALMAPKYAFWATAQEARSQATKLCAIGEGMGGLGGLEQVPMPSFAQTMTQDSDIRRQLNAIARL